jgi:hypothetical protein
MDGAAGLRACWGAQMKDRVDVFLDALMAELAESQQIYTDKLSGYRALTAVADAVRRARYKLDKQWSEPAGEREK